MRHPSGQNWQDDLSLQPSYWIWVIALPGQGEQSLNTNLFRAMTCGRVLFVHIPSFDSLQPWWGWPGQELWSWFDGWENFGSAKLSVCEGQRLGQNPGFSVPRPELLFFCNIFFFFFSIWTIFKVFIECVTTLLVLFMYWSFGREPCGILAP